MLPTWGRCLCSTGPYMFFISNFPAAVILIMPNTASVKINQTKELCTYIIAKVLCKNKAEQLKVTVKL